MAGGWREQLDSDVAPCLPEGTPVWLRADNAYYRGELIAWCRERGWDYSISLTHARKRAPVLDVIEGLPEDGWTDIGLGEDATLVRYRPAGWEEQSYVVIRRRRDRGQTLLLPVYTVILVSRDDLPLDELVRRHRGKQGQENAFKGPLIDLDLHHPPCRKFRANQAFYICGQIAQVLLRAVQYQLLAGPRPAPWPAAPDPLSGSGRGKAGAQRPALAARLRAQQLPARLALSRRSPARIAGPGASRSIPARNRQARGNPLVRRTAKCTVQSEKPPHPTSRWRHVHRPRHRCTRKSAS